MRTLINCIVAAILLAAPAIAEGTFKDVPGDHWAAPAVETLAKAGIVKGYADGTFKGDRPVTRYEFAVALAYFVQAFEESRKPVVSSSSPTATPTQASEHKEQSKVADPVEFLRNGGYLPKDSLILTDTQKPVTAEIMAEAFASVAAKLVAVSVPAQQSAK